jgi:hypothetical protein
MAGRQDLYVGKSGQMAVMAEFLMLGYNVAVPEVDVGDDILVIEDAKGAMYRVQVKTSNVRRLKGEAAFSARFQLPLKQLRRPIHPELYYVLTVRIEGGRWEFLVISRAELSRRHFRQNVGARRGQYASFVFTFREDSVDGYGFDFQEYRNHWTRYWTSVEHQ